MTVRTARIPVLIAVGLVFCGETHGQDAKVSISIKVEGSFLCLLQNSGCKNYPLVDPDGGYIDDMIQYGRWLREKYSRHRVRELLRCLIMDSVIIEGQSAVLSHSSISTAIGRQTRGELMTFHFL